MTNLILGIVIGLFLYFAGERFTKWAISIIKTRKADEEKKNDEKMKSYVNEAVIKLKERR